ncbi:hypothetical protein NX059_010671 [Plenodomus lindquistii]|nr:hypothetical protein NX059_010671 [Plenodomus lindquistii]
MAALKPLLVVVGINSRQGSSIAHSILETNIFRILGITTNAFCARSRTWLLNGVKLAQIADYSDVACLEQAFEGATAIFAVTDFYRHLDEHSTRTLADVRRRTVEEIAGSRELREGQAIVDAAAKMTGLQCLVLSTLLKVDAAAAGEEKRGLQQFKSKAAALDYLKERHPDLAASTRVLIPALYMEDWTMFLRRTEGDSFTFGTTLSPNSPIPWTNITKDMGTFFRVCLSSPPRTNHAAISCIATGLDICTLFTSVTGISCKYSQYTPVELSNLLGPRGHIMVDMLTHIGDKGYYNGPAIQYPLHLTGGNSSSSSLSHFTNFAAHMTATLPSYLRNLEQTTLCPDDGSMVQEFRSGRRSSEVDVRASSAEMLGRSLVRSASTNVEGFHNTDGSESEFMGDLVNVGDSDEDRV